MRKVALLIVCLLTSAALAMAQTTKVSGTIVDASGQPIIGATVLIKGTTTGIASDAQGKFTLVLPEGKNTLVISFLGYETQELKASPNMKIILKEQSQILEGVVVTGIGKMDKRMFTGATDRLDADKVRLEGIPDISRALEGRSAGVSVQNVSGTFGTAPKIRVRGATSIYGSSKPLWVVDGVIMDDAVEVSADALSSGDAVTLISSAIAGLNPDDIESFQILKDGSATSIYGARAMAGVVVITTKKGRAGVSTINYTGEFTTRLVPRYGQFNIMNSQDQMSVYLEMQQKGWLNFAESYRASNSGVYGKMYQLTNIYNPINGTWSLMNTPEARTLYLQQAEMRNTDWFDQLFTPSLMHNHAVSISSGTEKARYYASMSIMSDPGWTKASSVKRYTANVNTSFDLFNGVTLNLITNASYRKQKAPGTLSQEIDAVNGEVKRDFDINPYSYAINTSRTLDPKEFYTRNYAPFNILHELQNNYIDLDVTDLKFQGELKWKILQTLEVSALGAVKHQGTSQQHSIKDNSNQAEAYRAAGDATIRDSNPLLYKDPDKPNSLPQVILPEGGILDKREYKMFGYDFRATLDYNDVYSEDHIVNFLGGIETSSINRSQSYFRGWGYQFDKGGTPFYDYNTFKQGLEQNTTYYSNEETRTRNVAFFGNVTYSWKHRYTINGTIRYEGTNRMGKSQKARWLPTWNIAGSWNAHEENFFTALEPAFSHFTLKASYSLTADRGPADVTNSKAIFKNYTPWRPSANLQESAIEIQELENSELTYEKKHEFNIGIDMGFIDNRINLSGDYYTRRNFDLIGEIFTEGAGGQISKKANVASMKSYGIELTLSTKNIMTQNFKWTTDLIFSYAENEITKLDSRTRVIDLISGNGFARKGYAVRSLFSIPFQGLDQRGLPTFINEKGGTTITDINFQETRNVSFLKYEGPTDPTITGSFGNIFDYKNFRMNVFITYSFGNKIRLDPAFKAKYSDLTAMPKEFKNRWIKAGDEKYTNIPTIASKRQTEKIDQLKSAYNAYNYSDTRIADGGFVRMKEISLTYSFNKAFIQRIRLSNLQLKLQATNLFLIYADSKLNGQDPEFFRSGGVAAPMPKQFTLTLRVGL